MAEANEDGLGSLFCGDGLRLKVGSKLASVEVFEPGLDLISGDCVGVTCELVLSHIVSGVEESNSGGILVSHADKFSKSLLDAILGSGLDEEDITLKLGSSL